MVWGIFSSPGVGELIQCNKHINAKEYVNILEKELQLTTDKLFSLVNWANIIFLTEHTFLYC